MRRGLGRCGVVLLLTAAAAALGPTFVATPAQAALTSSEEAQIKDFYRAATLNQAQRIRSLIARPDLSATESADALKEATASVPFTDARAALLTEISFGASSDASRPVLAVATTRALLARADAVLVRLANNEDSRAAAELTAIYTYLAREIAEKSDALVSKTTRDDCTKAVSEHIDRNARALRPDGGPTQLVAARAQAEMLLVEMTPEGPTKRLDTADKLGLRGVRRQMLIEWGVLVVDGKNLDDARISGLRSVLDRLPGARADLIAIVIGDAHAQVSARRRILPLASDLTTAPASFWGDEVEPGDTSALAGAIGEIARMATQRALENRGELRARAATDAGLADREHPLGKPADPTVEGTVAAVVQLLLVDGGRTFEWTLARYLSAKRESAALLSDALGVLAALAPARGGQELTLPLGKPGPGGSIDLLPATAVRLFSNGAVSTCTFGGHTYTFDRDEATGAVRGVQRDNQPVNLGMFPNARMPMTRTSSWSYDGMAFAKLLGTPRAGMGPGPRVRLESESPEDVIATPAPANDFVIEGELAVSGGEAGIGFRAKTLRDTRSRANHDYLFGGVVALVPDASPPRIALVTREELSHEAYMAAPAEGPFAVPMHVRIEVKGTKVNARVGNATFHGTLPQSMRDGSIVLYAKQGARIELQSLTIKKL